MRKFRDLSIKMKVPAIMGVKRLAVFILVCLLPMIQLHANIVVNFSANPNDEIDTLLVKTYDVVKNANGSVTVTANFSNISDIDKGFIAKLEMMGDGVLL